MKKVILVFLNFSAGISLLVYPLVLMAGIMGFDAPGSENSIILRIVFWAILLSPILIILSIIFSRRKQSLVWGVLGCIPLLVFLFFFGNEYLKMTRHYKSDFDVLSRDFECSDNAFLHIDTSSPLESMVSVYLVEKRDYKYRKTTVAQIHDQQYVYILSSTKRLNLIDQNIYLCKNYEGNTITDIYNEISEKEIQNFLKEKLQKEQ